MYDRNLNEKLNYIEIVEVYSRVFLEYLRNLASYIPIWC